MSQKSCDYCDEQIHCRNLYVALRILEEELRYTERDDLLRAFHQLQRDIRAAHFGYPNGSNLCSLSGHELEARKLVVRANDILRELRRTVLISPA